MTEVLVSQRLLCYESLVAFENIKRNFILNNDLQWFKRLSVGVVLSENQYRPTTSHLNIPAVQTLIDH